MKILLKILAPLIALPVLFISCEKKNTDSAGTGNAEFNISVPAPDDEFSSKGDSVIASMHLMISVEDSEGKPVFTDKLIPVYAFGTGFTSENLEMPAGGYRLTKFLLINAAGKVICATPLEGSEMAYLVMDPLPTGFRIDNGKVTKVVPEVLAVNDTPPGKFGYVSFGVQLIKPLEFWTYCILENPLEMGPIHITDAKLTISTPSGWHYSFRLKAMVNHLVIRGGSDIYNFLLEKEGFQPHRLQFRAEQLKSTSPEAPLVLRLPWDNKLRYVEIQPGPEKGIDAMISNLDANKNFGDHKYFEATFLSEPVLTVMRSNRSLIKFPLDTLPKSATIRKAVLVLTYDLPVPFSNEYLTDIMPGPGIRWYGAVLQQITGPWDEHKVTWATAPATTEKNQVYLAPFIRNSNMIQIDVTRLIAPAATDVMPNHGMFFRLWPEDRFPGFRFASSDYPVATMRPKLNIWFTLP